MKTELEEPEPPHYSRDKCGLMHLLIGLDAASSSACPPILLLCIRWFVPVG